MRSLNTIAILAATGCAVAWPAFGRGGPGTADLAPHVAVYDLKLDRANPGAGIDDFRGRLVFEARGSACSGYWGETRFVGEVFGEQGSMLTDTRSTTFESADGKRFDFTTERYSGHELVEEAEGTARRKEGEVVVELERPDDETLRLQGDVVFPSEHMRMILDAARAGRRTLATPVYDGSETGRTVYDTTTFIGKERPAMPADEAGAITGNAAEALSDWSSWPVTIAYFDPNGETPDLPAYEFSYDLFGNGVSRSIRLDYGDFALSGRLVSLELADGPPCDL